MMKFFYKIILNCLGWSSKQDLSIEFDKYIVVVAPHTSNWDFIYGILFAYQLPFKIKFFAKSQLFIWPIKWFFSRLGGIPVDRSKNNDLVSQAVDFINDNEKVVIGLAPEGTRKRVDKWKTGFYYIALKANIPIALAYLDYKHKLVGIGKVFKASGDINKDFQLIESFYANINPKNPDYYNKKIF